MSSALHFSCNCGAFKGHLAPETVKNGLRIKCHCDDCRAVELYHNQPDPRGSGVDLFQMSPHMVHIDEGAEHLKLMRLSPNGMFRWYAACCGTPFANTLKKPGLPFAAIRTDMLEDATVLGKVKAVGFLPSKQAGKPATHKGGARMVFGLMNRMLSSRISGLWRQTPFFDVEKGTPVAAPHVISKEERAGLYD